MLVSGSRAPGAIFMGSVITPWRDRRAADLSRRRTASPRLVDVDGVKTPPGVETKSLLVDRANRGDDAAHEMAPGARCRTTSM